MNMHKILANAVVLAGFAAVPFIPFIVLSDSTFFPFIVGKNFVFRIVVELMFSAWLVLAYIDPAYRPKKSWLLGALAAIIAIITLSAIFGENPTKSFWSNFERMEGAVTYFHLFAYFIVASTVLTVRNLWRPYLNLHLAAGVIMAIYGVLQWAGDLTIVQDGARVNGTLGNAAYLGTYALVNIFIAAFFMVRESFTEIGERVRVIIYSAIIVLQTFVLYHTATRGAMYGLVVGIMITAFLFGLFGGKNKALRWATLSLSVLMALIIGLTFVNALRDTQFVKNSAVLFAVPRVIQNNTFIKKSPVLSRFAAISLTEQTTKSRFMVWNMAYQGFKERPAFGWGMENFNYVFNKYYDPKMYGQEQWFDRAHNVFFDWLIAGGAPGLLAYLSLFACAVYCIWRRADELSILEKSVLTGLLGGYFFQNLFVFDNLTSLIYFGTILAYVESVSHREQLTIDTATRTTDKNTNAKSRKRTADTEDLTFMVSGGAFILALVLIYTVNYNGFMQNTTLIRAMTRSTEGPMKNLALFKGAIAYDSFGTAEVREQLGQLSMNGFDRLKEISYIQRQFITLAASELEKQAKALPNDARYQIFAGNFLSRVGEIDKGLEYIKKAAALSPAKQTILFELGIAYYNKKDLENAEEVFKRAYNLAPEYDEAKKYYAQFLTLNGKGKEAKKVMGVDF